MRSGGRWLIGIALAIGLAAGGCREKGPAEKAGEKLDKAGEKISDAVNPKGPAEKAGREVDKATGND
jgi:hypothetical protein